LTALTLYHSLMERRLEVNARLEDCPKLARKVMNHPEAEAIKAQLRKGFLGKTHRSRWLWNLNFCQPFRHHLAWVHINAYLEWEALSFGRNPPAPNHEAVLVAIGAGDKSSGGRKRQTTTPSSQQVYASYWVWIGKYKYNLGRLERLASTAPEEHRAVLCLLVSGDRGKLPIEPTPAILEAVEWLKERL
jgi:hypothetical protein